MGEGAYIDKITLMHMEMKIDISKVVMQYRQGNEQLLAIYLIQQFYNETLEKLGPDATSRHYKQRALDTGKFFAIQRLPDLRSETEAGLYYLLDEAERTGWMHSDHFGYNSLSEMLLNMIDPESMAKGELSNWNFVARVMLPKARQIGIPSDRMLAASLQVKKLRESVPTCRRILREVEMGDKEPEEGDREFEAIVRWVADPKVTWTQFETNLGKREPPEVYRAINVYEVALPGGDTWLIIPTKTETDKRIVEKQLNHRMNKRHRAMPWLLDKIKEYLPGGLDNVD